MPVWKTHAAAYAAAKLQHCEAGSPLLRRAQVTEIAGN
jgi:hypothetical protein